MLDRTFFQRNWIRIDYEAIGEVAQLLQVLLILTLQSLKPAYSCVCARSCACRLLQMVSVKMAAQCNATQRK